VISRRREAIIGAGVMLLGAAVLAFAYGASNRAAVPGYELVARFNKAEGIGVGSDVRLAGVPIGKVVGQSLDDRFRAVIRFRVAPDILIPDDSAALIQTDGLLGAKFIALQPGADETNMKPGEELRYTQDSMNVQDLLEMIIAQGKAKRAGKPQSGAAQ
jgi:phospholipid/cholesterol/gamma-HCH transport system substrate-binding protein